MPDTTVRVEYIDAVQNFSEVTITGNQQVWRIGSSAFVETGRASQLVASGKFRSLANDPDMLPANQAKVGASTSAQGVGNVVPPRTERDYLYIGDKKRGLGRSTHEIHAFLKSRIRMAKGGRIGTSGRAPINIRVDHGMQDFFTTFHPLFVARDIPYTIGLLTETIGNPTHRYEPCTHTWAQVRDYINCGGSAWSHSRSHMDPVLTAALEGRTVDEVLEREIVLSAYEMWQNGILPVGWQQPGITPCQCAHYSSNFFAPEDWDSEPGRLILENYGINEMSAQAKTPTGTVVSTGGKYRALPSDGANDLAHFTLDGMTYAQVTAAVDSAIDYGAGIQFMFHPRFVAAGTVSWTVQNMTDFLDYIASKRDAGKLLPLTAEGLAFADMDSSKRFNIFAERFFQSGIVPGQAGSRWLRSGATGVPLTIAADAGNPGNYIVTQPSSAAGYIYQGVGTTGDHQMWGHAFMVEVECRNTAQTTTSQMRISIYIDNVLIPNTNRLQTIAADSQWKTIRQVFVVPPGAVIVQARVDRPLGDGNIEYRRFEVNPT